MVRAEVSYVPVQLKCVVNDRFGPGESGRSSPCSRVEQPYSEVLALDRGGVEQIVRNLSEDWLIFHAFPFLSVAGLGDLPEIEARMRDALVLFDAAPAAFRTHIQQYLLFNATLYAFQPSVTNVGIWSRAVLSRARVTKNPAAQLFLIPAYASRRYLVGSYTAVHIQSPFPEKRSSFACCFFEFVGHLIELNDLRPNDPLYAVRMVQS